MSFSECQYILRHFAGAIGCDAPRAVDLRAGAQARRTIADLVTAPRDAT
jgi:hypothetical protein